jgi:hypothetical protein
LRQRAASDVLIGRTTARGQPKCACYLKYEFPTLQLMPEVRPPPGTTEQIVREIDFINEYNARIATNLRRAGNLIEFAENHFPKEASSQTKDDILRAAVVFLHATLEDFLRYIGCKQTDFSSLSEILNFRFCLC